MLLLYRYSWGLNIYIAIDINAVTSVDVVVLINCIDLTGIIRSRLLLIFLLALRSIKVKLWRARLLNLLGLLVRILLVLFGTSLLYLLERGSLTGSN